MRQVYNIPDIEILIQKSGVNLQNQIITFGKYNGKSIVEVFKFDVDYIEWLERQHSNNPNTIAIQKAVKFIRGLQFDYFKNFYDSSRIKFDNEYKLPFGKHVGQKLRNVMENDPDYVMWLKTQIPNIQNLYESWIILKTQISLHEQIEQSESIVPSAPTISATVLETYNLYSEGKSIEDIAKIRQMKTATIEDHIARCIELKLIAEVPMLDIETRNYIINIINEKCEGKTDKLKPIKIICDDGEFEISYAQIKYAIAFMRN